MTDDEADTDNDEEMDRAARVRNRRSRRDRRSKTQESSDNDSDASSEPSQTAQTSETESEEQTSQIEQSEQTSSTSEKDQMTQADATSTTAEPRNQQPIKDRTHETFYLRDDLRRELRQISGQSNLDFEFEYGVELEKNRHLRPLLLYLGAKQMEEMNATDIKDVLDSTDILDSTEIDE